MRFVCQTGGLRGACRKYQETVFLCTSNRLHYWLHSYWLHYCDATIPNHSATTSSNHSASVPSNRSVTIPSSRSVTTSTNRSATSQPNAGSPRTFAQWRVTNRRNKPPVARRTQQPAWTRRETRPLPSRRQPAQYSYPTNRQLRNHFGHRAAASLGGDESAHPLAMLAEALSQQRETAPDKHQKRKQLRAIKGIRWFHYEADLHRTRGQSDVMCAGFGG